MKLKVIKKEELSGINDMDPFSVGSRLFLPGYYCIGAFPENNEENVPYGILIYCDTGNELIVNWLYVAVEHRGCGIGERLLSGIYILARKRSYKQIGAVLCDTPDTRSACPVWEGYLWDRYFDKKGYHAGEWHVKLKSILKKRAFREKKIESDPGVICRMARDLTVAQKNEIIKRLASDDAVLRMYKKEQAAGAMDDVSIFCFDDRELCGAAVFEANGRDLYLTYFYALRDDLVYYMLPAAIIEAFRDHPGTVLHIAVRENDYEELFSELLGSPDKTRMLMAQTEMFFADQDYEEYEVPDFFEALSASIAES